MSSHRGRQAVSWCAFRPCSKTQQKDDEKHLVIAEVKVLIWNIVFIMFFFLSWWCVLYSVCLF